MDLALQTALASHVLGTRGGSLEDAWADVDATLQEQGEPTTPVEVQRFAYAAVNRRADVTA